ncbi:hypothetical protein [Fusobacterium canifelinum]|uniref:Uncharacterized protein n=1 Tax=Fusobacterium canifelinum TaxID=285729 RepID=A0A3P1V4G2_9FUSO|nr:hypothetical protein [Fusobacterium canifelinum]QQB73379.1 hypothetical protein I6H56_08625 [Fusobacterium canifelinum]RRD28758.1 hypothetical protein EII27_00765 [Fusobacterium canifelinum]
MSDDNIKEYGEVCFTLSNGTYTAGMDIPEGKYKLVAKHGYGDVYSSNEEMGIDEYMEAEDLIDDSDEDNESATEFSNLVLKIGDKVTIEDSLVLEFSSKNANLTQSIVRKEIGKEIILKKGVYTCGKDFEIGVYDIVLVEDSGNIEIEENDIGNSYFFGSNYDDIRKIKNYDFKIGEKIHIYGKDFVIKLSPSKNCFIK